MNFGISDGHSESKEPHFSEMFYEQGDHYRDLVNTSKFLIIGRKGTGKTILASYYTHRANKEKNKISIQLFPNDFKRKKLLNFAQNPINRDESSLFWDYVFLLDVSTGILEYIEKEPRCFFKKMLYFKKIHNLKSTLRFEKYKIESIVLEEHNSLDYKTSFGKENSLNTGYVTGTRQTTNQRRAKYYEILTDLKASVCYLLKVFGLQITVFYDDMDQFEEDLEFEYFKSLLKNMIYSADLLNKELRQFNGSKICLVLREDLVDMLQEETSNLNKQVTDQGIWIRWFDQHFYSPYQHPLMQMVLYKIKNSGDDFKNNSLKEIYTSVFEPKVFEYIMERGFGRPREFVAYLNLYKQKYPNEERITISQLGRREQEYSKWFYDEFLNELAISSQQKRVKSTMEAISKRGYGTLTLDKLCAFMREREIEFESEESIFDTLQVMRNYDVIGLSVAGNYQFNYRLGYSPKIDKKSKLVLHRGFRKFLNIR